LNEKWMLKPLMDLGLTETEALLYLYLTKEGPKNAREVSEALKLYRQKLYRSLEKMQGKGIVKASQEYPARFSAVPFEKVVDLVIKVNIEQAKYVMQNREELLSGWRSIIRKE
jgi:sugar-specific transcriptional regulator TrmB